MTELNKEELINTVMPGGGHLVILGAGASKALIDKHGGDKNGIQIPVMNELVNRVGLEDIIRATGYKGKLSNFEKVYSEIYNYASKEALRLLETKVEDFFKKIQIPNKVTAYDLLLTGLRKRDVVATFNWDPLIVQSYKRLLNMGLAGRLPELIFLHGNVAMGYCEEHKVTGPLSSWCAMCNKPYTPTPLLYPVEKKDYASNKYIKSQWSIIRQYLKYARVVTIYGYRAPKTDSVAISLLQKGWGKNTDRAMEQFELIIRPDSDEDNARNNWNTFIHTHHYDIHDDFDKSYIFKTPRRTIELWWEQNFEVKWVEPNPYPSTFRDLKELVEWLQPLFKAEDNMSRKTSKP